MATKKAKSAQAILGSKAGKDVDAVTRDGYIRMRMTPDFKDWIEELADHCQLTMTSTITRALIAHAKREGFAKPAPKR